MLKKYQVSELTSGHWVVVTGMLCVSEPFYTAAEAQELADELNEGSEDECFNCTK